jgi:eukaryotic-like serine/threonine-protein kinase
MAMPARIGRYRVLGVVGQGAMGVVYRGRDDSLDRDVALKLMRAAAGPEDRSRFLREARAAARLQHPNIVTIYEADEEDGEPFIAMELLEGMDLQRAIEAGLRPDPKVTLPIVLQLLAGLGHAHDQGIVHRDVKPSNLFLPRKRPAKIMDFGVAHLAGGSAAAGIVGTPNYMSPEQVRSGNVDGRSDVFSAGLILYELVTGEKAYRGDSVVSLLYKIAHEDADLSLLPRGDEWARLREVLATSLARDPEQRYPSAGHMHDQLSLAFRDLGGGADWKTASDRGVLARSGSRRAASAPLPGERTAASPVTVPAPRGSRAGLARAGAAGLAGLAVLAAGGLLLLRARRPPEASTPVTSLAPSPPPAPATTPPSSAPAPSPRPAMPPPASPRPFVRATPREPPPAGEETPAPAGGHIDRANDLLEKGRFAAALAEARAVLRRDPGNAEAKMIAEEAEAATVVETRLKDARAALRRGDRDAALAEVRAGLAVSPNDARLLALFRELVRE